MNLNSLETVFKPYVLAADDEPLNRYLLEDIIEERYELKVVDSGQACLDAVNERTPDLILLDINMPGMSGFDVCKALKADPETSSVPIIFLTAMLGVNDERTGLEIGAVDYITKPFTESILLARMKTHLTLSHTRKLLEQSHNLLRQERDYIEQIILSMRKDRRFDRNNLSLLVSPVEKSNGDIVLSASNEANHQHIIIGDFTGHGLTAAIAGPLVSSLFYSQVKQCQGACDILRLINDELYCKLPTQNFLAATYFDWDRDKHEVTVWNFGMPSTVIIDSRGNLTKIPSMTLALGVIECDEHDFEPVTIPFQEGDSLYAYTDGIEEVKSDAGELFGSERVHMTFEEIKKEQLALEVVLHRIEEFNGGTALKDDATLIELKGLSASV